MKAPDLDTMWVSPSALVWYLGGILTAQGWQYVKAKWEDHKHPEEGPHQVRVFNSFWISVAISLAMMLYIMAKTDMTYRITQQARAEAEVCQQEFNEAVRRQREIATANDHRHDKTDDTMLDWIHDLILPEDPEILKLDPNDPRRVAYGIKRTNEAYDIMRHVREERQDAERKLAETPLPSPKCGAKK